MSLVVDTSAAVAILVREPDADRLLSSLSSDASLVMSAAAFLELTIAMSKYTYDGLAAAQGFVKVSRIKVKPLTAKQARIAAVAWKTYGKGNHRATLNFGDCMTYALAKDLGAPLLFKGNDFLHTDLRAAE